MAEEPAVTTEQPVGQKTEMTNTGTSQEWLVADGAPACITAHGPTPLIETGRLPRVFAGGGSILRIATSA